MIDDQLWDEFTSKNDLNPSISGESYARSANSVNLTFPNVPIDTKRYTSFDIESSECCSNITECHSHSFDDSNKFVNMDKNVITTLSLTNKDVCMASFNQMRITTSCSLHSESYKKSTPLVSCRYPVIPPNIIKITACTNQCTLTNTVDDVDIIRCPYIQCNICDYPVIFFTQSSKWEEGAPEDIYLHIRTCYPDLNMLSSKHLVLLQPPLCEVSLAYCCQCSWFSCSDKSFTITSPIGLKSRTKANSAQCTTASGESKGKKLPYWVCRGHYCHS